MRLNGAAVKKHKKREVANLEEGRAAVTCQAAGDRDKWWRSGDGGVPTASFFI